MKIQGFPGCCGAACISELHLPGAHYADPDPKMEEKLQTFLTRGAQKGCLTGGFVDDRLRTVAIVITVARQEQAIKLIKKQGGIAVGKFTNQNTGGVNIVWMVPILPSAEFSRVTR